MEEIRLIFEDGTEFKGRTFTVCKKKEVFGEVVFIGGEAVVLEEAVLLAEEVGLGEAAVFRVGAPVGDGNGY